ncbi:alpha/beta hydrolase [Lewinella sp. IMCC34191]|uniref:alpha/beta hydrolase n=1 Tax=Lewinella sp. IMCC34191 TaxID=2259172 RepID=UPI000E248B8A|nr:alpha/beta fold hydrolase [Lewinella sp. IMCC34191]
MKNLLVALGAILLIYLVITFFVSGMVLDTPHRSLEESYRIGRERWHLNLDSIEASLPPRERVSFRSPVDDLILRGWWYRRDTATCGILLAHGYHDTRVAMLKYTPLFDHCGCDLLLYDHRGFGESDEAYATGGVNEASDLIAAHQYLKELTGLSDDRIGWVGESWGAAAALIAAGSGSIRPAFLVAESPYADWETAITERGVRDFGPVLSLLTPGTFAWVGVRNGTDFAAASPVAYADQIASPVLLVHSRQDTLTAPRQSDLIAERVQADLLTYRPLDWGAWHAHNIVWRPGAYARMVDSFLLVQSAEFCR